MADAVSRSAAESGAPAPAQELYILWGGQHTEDLDDNTYSYGFEYLHNLSEHWVARFCWLNEGHVTNHHRDGHTVPAWASATASELERDFVVELFAVRVTPRHRIPRRGNAVAGASVPGPNMQSEPYPSAIGHE